MKRALAAFLAACVVVVPALAGVDQAWCARAFRGALHVTGLVHPPGLTIETLSETAYRAGRTSYETDAWCTPMVLCLCGISLLWFGQQRPQRYFVTCICFEALATALLVLNVVVSTYLHERGMDWTWAHFPGCILVYGGLLFACGLHSEIAMRRPHRLEVVNP